VDIVTTWLSTPSLSFRVTYFWASDDASACGVPEVNRDAAASAALSAMF
jgi:hypothetical protein